MGLNGNAIAIGIGDSFGLLTVVATVPSRNGMRRYACRCSCGKDIEAYGTYLNRGRVASCGCSRRTHGLTGSKEYWAWHDMRARCANPKHKSYANYGGRGIGVCERWGSFESFYADMGPAPAAAMSLDRIDNNGNYEPANCRWTDLVTQSNNTRANRRVTLNGKTETFAGWSKITGLPYHVIKKRIDKGWSAKSALMTPLNQKRSNG